MESVHPMNAATELRSLVPNDALWSQAGSRWPELDKNLWACAGQFVKETNPAPVDEAFARRVAVRLSESQNSIEATINAKRDGVPARLLYSKTTKAMFLFVNGDRILMNPTQGQFWTAVRLFNVQVKESSEPGEQ